MPSSILPSCLATPPLPIFSYRMTTKKNFVASIVKNWRVRSHKHGGIIMVLVQHPILNDMNTLHVVVVSNSHARLSGEIVMVWLLPVLPIKSRPPSRNKISDSYNSRGLKTCTSPFRFYSIFLSITFQHLHKHEHRSLNSFFSLSIQPIMQPFVCASSAAATLSHDSIEMSLERCSLEKVKC